MHDVFKVSTNSHTLDIFYVHIFRMSMYMRTFISYILFYVHTFYTSMYIRNSLAYFPLYDLFTYGTLNIRTHTLSDWFQISTSNFFLLFGDAIFKGEPQFTPFLSFYSSILLQLINFNFPSISFQYRHLLHYSSNSDWVRVWLSLIGIEELAVTSIATRSTWVIVH